MGKSDHGPDLLDCSQLALDIQSGQDCAIAILLEPVGTLGGGSWRVGLVATSRRLTVSGPEWTAAVHAVFPHRDWRTLEGCLFNSLFRLDAVITKRRFEQVVGLT